MHNREIGTKRNSPLCARFFQTKKLVLGILKLSPPYQFFGATLFDLIILLFFIAAANGLMNHGLSKSVVVYSNNTQYLYRSPDSA